MRLRTDRVSKRRKPHGFRIGIRQGQRRADRTAQLVRYRCEVFGMRHPAGGQFTDPAGAVPVGQYRVGDLRGDHRAAFRYGLQFFGGHAVCQSEMDHVTSAGGEPLPLKFPVRLAGERADPPKQFGQQVQVALLPFSQCGIRAERGHDRFDSGRSFRAGLTDLRKGVGRYPGEQRSQILREVGGGLRITHGFPESPSSTRKAWSVRL